MLRWILNKLQSTKQHHDHMCQNVYIIEEVLHTNSNFSYQRMKSSHPSIFENTTTWDLMINIKCIALLLFLRPNIFFMSHCTSWSFYLMQRKETTHKKKNRSRSTATIFIWNRAGVKTLLHPQVEYLLYKCFKSKDARECYKMCILVFIC